MNLSVPPWGTTRAIFGFWFDEAKTMMNGALRKREKDRVRVVVKDKVLGEMLEDVGLKKKLLNTIIVFMNNNNNNINCIINSKY